MQLDSVRALKAQLTSQIVEPTVTAALTEGRFGVRSHSARKALGPVRAMALGIARRGKDYQLAVRLQRRSLEEDERMIRAISEEARGEVDVRYVGRLFALDRAPRRGRAGVPVAAAAPWHRQEQRPLLIGSSIAHYRVTAGTLGAFVRRRADGQLAILSNNHVLANENAARIGDPILQPGPYDGGTSADQAGALLDFVRLRRGVANFVDAAISSMDGSIGWNASQLTGLGTLGGLRQDPLDAGDRVAKVGRTTGVTWGTVTAVELDGVVVGYDSGNLSFDNQIEIEGAGPRAFSAGGDSGSVIVDADMRACALLFAGGDVGGSNGKGLTYANPIGRVMDDLAVSLAV
ncbi:hypothetical protein [Phenylobacterium kunshanense]|uniref:Peptidase S1 n=1 Tax=Phenylobacterium kunshanense TaxID=1445034 RepID=A0A328B9A5_9CAUL|nr:hypothetical protein [Phenylobacterium kunshanense]RAK63409.1 hypothetical protein DJ019_16950 [Phenylobacterium kunshanense]